MDAASPVPLYHQLAERIRTAVQSGSFQEGSIIGPELRLAKDFHVSLNTVRRAMEILSSEGVLLRKPGLGTFVAGKVSSRAFRVVRHIEQRANQPAHSVVSVRETVPDRIVEERLRLTSGGRVWCMVRLEMISDRPTAIFEDYNFSEAGSHYPSSSYEDGTEAMLVYVQGKVSVASHEIKAVGANVGIAQALKVDAGAPLIVLERTVFDEIGNPVGFGRYSFLASHYEFEVTF
ncbi:GntR family transcriptional regulator [Arthrobacter sp. MMS18-M83]|uniref:GntR family transcriptional regulator n=1 Tax=Arthrobacter sp. MMS18-M83 TaxID=2996261 RepID=UPI00227D6706|nr:GntR family transcriptional regulator [Arthrobacter sp. MMS18-M83]WAH96218.1 GntR family transcriptional regulator [Arthrobacter sp. MMS18-M83]